MYFIGLLKHFRNDLYILEDNRQALSYHAAAAIPYNRQVFRFVVCPMLAPQPNVCYIVLQDYVWCCKFLFQVAGLPAI